jgi:Leucine-rich repeat (LRR) protein
VREIIIMYTSVVQFDENIFNDLINITKAVIIENQLTALPRNIFKNNQNLKYLDLSYNKLQTIPTVFPTNLMSLKLFNNVCIDMSFNSTEYFDTIREKCWNDTTSTGNVNALEKFNELQESIILNSEKISQLEGSLSNVKNSMQSDISTSAKVKQLDLSLKGTVELVSNQAKRIDDLEEKKKLITNIVSEITENISQIQKSVSEHVDDDRVDKQLTQLAFKEEELESNQSVLKKCIIALFVIVILLILVFVTVLVIFKFIKTDNRESLLLNAF